MCEFLVNESDNTHWLIEANPRYWGTTGLDIDAGVDFPYYQYQLSVQNTPADFSDTYKDPYRFSYKEGLKSRWIIGDIISFLNNLRTGGENKRRYRDYFRCDDDFYMDLKKDDIAAFAGESVYYFKKFVKFRSTNPVDEGTFS